MQKQTAPPIGQDGVDMRETSSTKDTDKSLAQILPCAGKLTKVSLELPASLNKTQWQDVGIALSRLDEAKQWWIGDWWAFGEHKYGERKAIVEDDDWTGPSFGTCANNASICRAFETSRRRELLSFHHHEFFVGRGFDTELVDALLDWCEAPLEKDSKRPRSVPELEREINRRENRALYEQVVRSLDKRIQQRCKKLSKAKRDVFKAEIIKQLQYKLNTTWQGDLLRRVDLEMLVEKTMNDTLGASMSGDPLKLIEFIRPIRDWAQSHTAKQFDEIVEAVPIERARDDLSACRIAIEQLQIFIEMLEARIAKLQAAGVEIPLGVAEASAEEWTQNRRDRADRVAREAALKHLSSLSHDH